MKRRASSRRRFLAATGAAGIAGLAGCSALTTDEDGEDSDDPSETESETGADEDPTTAAEALFEGFVEQYELREALFHSEVAREWRLESYEVELVEEDLSPSDFAGRLRLDEETATAIATDAETAIVEIDFEVYEDGETVDEKQRTAIATEDGEWRIVEMDLPDEDSDQGRREPEDVAVDGEEIEDIEMEREDGIPEEVHEFLAESDANGYDGTLTDLTGNDSVTIGAGVEDPPYRFDPVVVTIDAGAEVVWEWAGEAPHTITHVDGEFDSGLIDGKGETWSYTFDEPGSYMYYCAPHRALGELGAIIVE